MKHSMKVFLDEVEWEVHFVSKKEMPKSLWGDCCARKRRIRVRHDLSTKNFVDTFLHELLHAANWQTFSEEFVAETASEMARALVECGMLSINRQEQ